MWGPRVTAWVHWCLFSTGRSHPFHTRPQTSGIPMLSPEELDKAGSSVYSNISPIDRESRKRKGVPSILHLKSMAREGKLNQLLTHAHPTRCHKVSETMQEKAWNWGKVLHTHSPRCAASHARIRWFPHFIHDTQTMNTVAPWLPLKIKWELL